jgi:hypothetical protein
VKATVEELQRWGRRGCHRGELRHGAEKTVSAALSVQAAEPPYYGLYASARGDAWRLRGSLPIQPPILQPIVENTTTLGIAPVRPASRSGRLDVVLHLKACLD